MENRKMVPEIRFSGFTDPWEQRKIGDIANFYKGNGLSWNDISENAKQECILYGNLYTDYGMITDTVLYRTDTEITNAVYSDFGDVLIPASDTTPTGLARATSIEKSGVLLGGDINIIRPKKKIKGSCLSLAINANKGELIKLIKGTTVRHIHNSEIQSVVVVLPTNLYEQEVIIGYFKTLDSLITLHQRKLEKLQTIKKAMLDKMFPKNGKLVPEIRFSGFTDPWEQRKFNEIAVTRRGLTYNPSDVCEDGIRVLRSSNIKEDTFVTSDDDVFVKKDAINIPYACDGDILITSANGSSHLVGKHAIIRQIHNNSAVIGGFMLLATTKNSQFLNASMGSSWYTKFINLSVAGGNGAIGNLSKNELDENTLFVPSDVEQETIGHFFKNIDNLITLHQRKLEKLQNIKKSMLNKMFI